MEVSARSAEELERWIRTDMRMSHIYQPAVLRALLDAGGVATVRKIAQALPAADEAQFRWYEDRAKAMPLRVLKQHGILSVHDGLVELSTTPLSFEERARLRAACEERIGRFLADRGLSTWAAGLIETDPVPESIRYRVLLCGADPEKAMLQVDHIVPRRKGGTNAISNLQTLCDRCNRGKSNRDDTRLLAQSDGE